MIAAQRSNAGGLAVILGWLFVVSALAALGYGLWAVYLSGQPLAGFEAGSDYPSAQVFGPLDLEPGMNPIRVNLRAGHVPFGSSRIHYRLTLSGNPDARIWEKRGVLGSTDDTASEVWSDLTLGVIEVPRAGQYRLEASFSGPSSDHLRSATIRLRRNVHVADPRWLWGLAGVAALSLGGSVLFRRPSAASAASYRRAA